VSDPAASDFDVAYANGAAGPIAYRDSGPDQVDTIVFVHGVNMASGVWEEVIANLPRFRCIAFDLRGHGLSVQRGPYGIDDYLADLSAVLDATQAVNVGLVGVSMGGLVSCAFAQRHPDLVQAVVTFGSAFVGQHLGLDTGMARMREVGVADYFTWSLPRGSLPANVSPQVRDRAIELAVTGRDDVTMVEEIIRSSFEQDLAYVLPGPVGRPVLVVNGEHDRTCTPEGGQQLAAAAGGRWLLVPDAGHVIPLEQPVTCAELVADFYRESRTMGTGDSLIPE
jgi:pimeloyl-ACP methyl ester carboxylesterase